MNSEQLEDRLAAVEQTLADLQQRLMIVTNPTGYWQPRELPMSEDDQQAHFEAMAYGRYFRRTGHEAPSTWKPGDPLPEPDCEP